MSTQTPINDEKPMKSGATFEHKGRSFRFTIEIDEDMGPPWKEHDGHGVISERTSRLKRKDEWLLQASLDGSYYYDTTATLAVAKRDQWGASGLPENATQEERLGRAIAQDFERMRAWCNGDWQWIGVKVNALHSDGCACLIHERALWGIESDAGAYLNQVARELADELIMSFSDSPASASTSG